ncbi:D-alanyl-D-alanine carboxypeptidase [Streptomyces sp. NPDC088760]|uniref:D-alanyl-D-alanine carboxypeptidase n=1 Tax=Streptomyces sp. NPDC088760 TaxID=3365890 RepID=UPI0037FBC81B
MVRTGRAGERAAHEEASVAGESPDRSKQRESSAEPTSGSADSVPEARDPRLAVSREKDSAGGSRDTATKILTVRPDTALHEAVSSWVRAPHPDTTAKSPASETEPEESSETGSGAGIPSQEKAEAEAEGSSDARAEAETPSDAKAKAESEGASDAQTEADAEGQAKADATAKNGTDADAKADKADARAGVAGGKAGAKAAADGKGRAGAKPDADGKGHAGAKADADGKAGTGGEAAAAGKTPAGAKADADTKAVSDSKAATGTEDAADAKADAGSKALPGDKAPAGAKADVDAKRAADSKALPGDKAGAGDKADADTKAVAGSKAGAGAEDVADAEGDAGGAGGEGVVEAVEVGDGPEDADGGDAPQGPPADDDESRTGGAGGNTDADGGAEAKADAAQATPAAEAKADAAQATPAAEAKADAAAKPPVDQPTAVFKAPRPKKAEVDQPTTMLKLGGQPKAPESDAERTSKFVALRDDLRKPAKPQPAAPDATTPVPQVGPERTTQQPLPPKPPLDLLAELTNTPPPPETPVRTLVRRVKIWTPLILLLAVVFAVVQAVRPLPSPTLALTGEETYTFDGGRTTLPWPGEGQGWIDADGVGTMGHFGKQTPVAIGSVAKTMTAYIILKHHPLKPGQEGPKIKVDAKAEKEGGYDKAGESTLNTVKAGDYLTEKQALSAVMIPSANNIARLLARWDAGSEAAFVKEMNATARELGMTDTTYTDPSGLKETTVSTAEDQVKLGRAFVKVPALVAISSAASWTDPSGHFWPNYNELPYRMGAIGIKTGSTTAAGGNLLFASRKQVGGRTVTLVGAILGQHKPKILETVNAVSKTALLAAQDALTTSKILKKGDVVGYVDDRLGGHTPVVVTQDVTAAGWAGMKVRLSFTPGTVPHTAKAGTRVGTLTVGDGTSGAVKVPVALQKDLAEPGFGAKLTRLG